MTRLELLTKVKERIIAEPACYDQDGFCGTQCCIAGQIDCVLNGVEVHKARGANSSASDEVETIALRALGEPSRMVWLFGPICETEDDDDDDDEDRDWKWPLDLSVEYNDALTKDDYAGLAQVGCKAIDRYIEQRGPEALAVEVGA